MVDFVGDVYLNNVTHPNQVPIQKKKFIYPFNPLFSIWTLRSINKEKNK